jgi:hypothetical protein
LHGDGTNGAQNNTFIDSSSNNFTITRNGNTTQGTFTPFSQTGWSNVCADVGDSYLRISSNSALNQSGDFTIEAFIYLTSYPAAAASIYGFEVTGFFKFDVNTSGNLTVNRPNIGFFITGATALQRNAWNHVALVRSGTGTNNIKIYLNGVVDAQGTNTTNITASGTGFIGSSLTGAAQLDGYISNLRVTNTAVYTSSFTPPTAPLTAISGTQLLTCQSNRFVDNSTNLFAITTNGTPSVQAFSPFAPTAPYSTSVVGGSGYFDGAGDYLVTPSSTAFDVPSGGQWCLDFWVYTSVSGFKAVFNKNWPFGGLGPTQGFYLSGTTATYSDGGSGTAVLTASIVPPLSQWNHYVYTKDSTNTIRIFVNGVLAGSVVRNTAIGTFPVFIGIASNLAAGSTSAGYYGDLRFVNGSIPTTYQTSSTTNGTTIFSVPTAPTTTTSQGATSGDVKLLLNFTNAGIIDNTAKNDLETVGNAQISTSVKQFGTGSIAFDGTGDYLQLPASVNNFLGTSDFTIEAWVYIAGNASLNNNSVRDAAILTLIGGTNISLTFIIRGDATTTGTGFQLYQSTPVVSNLNVTGTISQLTWHHIAVSRSGSSVRFFLNGTQMGTTQTNSSSWGSSTQALYVGSTRQSGFNNDLNGYIDDLRITRGFARYTANFTPPTAAFADQ